jgi:hypothetical protein
VLTDSTASTRTIDGSSTPVAGCVDWQIMRPTLWRADFDDARNANSLPLKKARPGQRRHSGPRCLSPDTMPATQELATWVETNDRWPVSGQLANGRVSSMRSGQTKGDLTPCSLANWRPRPRTPFSTGGLQAAIPQLQVSRPRPDQAASENGAPAPLISSLPIVLSP